MRTKTSRGSFEPKVIEDLNNRDKSYTYEAMTIKYDLVGLKYTPDLVLSSGVIVELKGRFMRKDQKKMLAVRNSHPELDIRFVFQKLKASIDGAAKRKDGTRMTCEEWAKRYNFKYAELIVPEQWFEIEPEEDGEPEYKDQGAFL